MRKPTQTHITMPARSPWINRKTRITCPVRCEVAKSTVSPIRAAASTRYRRRSNLNHALATLIASKVAAASAVATCPSSAIVNRPSWTNCGSRIPCSAGMMPLMTPIAVLASVETSSDNSLTSKSPAGASGRVEGSQITAGIAKFISGRAMARMRPRAISSKAMAGGSEVIVSVVRTRWRITPISSLSRK